MIAQTAGPTYVCVHVEDTIDPRSAGYPGCRYDSPPQPPDQALALVRVLLHSPDAALAENRRWDRAIAFGRRTITLTEPPAEPATGPAPAPRSADTPHNAALL